MRSLTSTGRLVRAAVAATAVIGVFAPFSADPAQAGQNVFIEVTPNTVQAGERVSLRAGCDGANDRQATVQSDAFGRAMLRPDNGFLTGAVTIPGNRNAGDYGVDLRCANGLTASTRLTVLNMSQPTKGPATGGGGTAGEDSEGRGTGSLLLAGGLTAVAVAAGLGLVGNRRRQAGRPR